MPLTSFIDYGLQMPMRMAGDPRQGISTAEKADEFGLSQHCLTKIVQKRAQTGYLTTRRLGGALLARPAATIRLLAEGQPLVEGLATDGRDCTIDGRGRLNARLRSAMAAFLTDLDHSTLTGGALHPGLPREEEPA